MSVFSIAQDKTGYMWFATRDGLARYDGAKFTVYREESGSESAISHNEVTSLLASSGGLLWVGTRGGLNLYDPGTDAFIRYYAPESLPGNSIYRMMEDGSGAIWLCTDGGLCRFLPEKGTYDRIVKPEYGSLLYVCRSVDPDILIAATPSTVFKYSISSDSLTPLTCIPKDPDIQSLMCDSRGNIWIATAASGVTVLSAELEPLKEMRAREGALNNDYVRCFAEDHDGNIIIGTYDGLNVYSPADDAFSSYRIDTSTNVDALSFFSVLTAYCDRDGSIWLGSFVGGVNYFNPASENFLNYEEPHVGGTVPIGIVSSIVGHGNHLWIGKEGGGLLRYDMVTGEYENVPLPGDENFRANIVNSLARHGSDLWVGLNNGRLHNLDINTGRVLKSYRMPFDQPVVTLHIDNEKNVYIGTYLRRSESDLLVIRPDGTIRSSFEDAATGKKAAFNYVCSIVEEKDGSVLLGSYIGGIYRYNIHTGVYSYDTLSGNKGGAVSVNQLFKDNDGKIWVATRRNGLLLLDKEFNIVDSFTRADGLISDNICSVIRGPDGLLWLTTPSSISSLNPETRETRVWQSREVNEFSLRSCHTVGNTVIFGADKGIIFLSPENSHISYTARKPVVEMITEPESRSVRMSFSCLDYIETRLIRYEYKLDGYDRDWIKASPGSTDAVYRNLPAGRYTFRVRAFKGSEDSIGSGDALKQFRIAAPVWLRWWAKVLYLLAALAVVMLALRLIKTKKSMEAERNRLQEMCADLFAQNQKKNIPGSTSDEAFMMRFYDLLSRKLADDSLSIDYLCSELGTSRTGLYNKVKKNTGMAPIDFVRISRLRASIELLKDKKHSVAEIASLVGFGTPSYYISCFKKEYGCTPKEFLNKNI